MAAMVHKWTNLPSTRSRKDMTALRSGEKPFHIFYSWGGYGLTQKSQKVCNTDLIREWSNVQSNEQYKQVPKPLLRLDHWTWRGQGAGKWARGKPQIEIRAKAPWKQNSLWHLWLRKTLVRKLLEAGLKGFRFWVWWWRLVVDISIETLPCGLAGALFIQKKLPRSAFWFFFKHPPQRILDP